MTTDIEFATKQVADAVRDDFAGALSERDDRRLKTVRFDEGELTERELTELVARAESGRAERSGAGQVPLTDAERDRIDFTKGREAFLKLLKGQYRPAEYVAADGTPDRSAGELALVRHIGFWFDRNARLARYIFEELADLSKYHENQNHRGDMFVAVRSVDWIYTNEVSLDARLAVARALNERETAKKTTLVDAVRYSDRTVRRALSYFRHENAVTLDRRGQNGAYWIDDHLGEFIDTYDQGELPTAGDRERVQLSAD